MRLVLDYSCLDMIPLRIQDDKMVTSQANGESLLQFSGEFLLFNAYQLLIPFKDMLLHLTSPSLLLTTLLSPTAS